MKPRALFLPILASLLVLLAMRLFRPGRETLTDSPSVDASAAAPNPAPNAQEDLIRYGVPPPAGPLATEPLPPGGNLQAQLEELARRRGVSLTVLTQQAVAELSNALRQATTGPLDFYGKVVDTDGAPQGGALARLSCLIYPENQFITNIVTDASGLFELHGVTGTAIRVTVGKDGFQKPPKTNDNFFVYYGSAIGVHHPDPNNPVIFTLRKKAARQN